MLPVIAFVLAPLGRCAVDYHDETLCGGGGVCQHSEGFGMHWRNDSRCDCAVGYCEETAKRVVTAAGAANVSTCVPCATVDLTYNGSALASQFTPWAAGAAQCAEFGAGAISPPTPATVSSVASSPLFRVGPDTTVSVVFHGGGADGYGGVTPLPRSLSGAPSARGYLGVAIAADGHYEIFEEGGGFRAVRGATRTITAAQLAPYKGREVQMRLVSSYSNAQDDYGWTCVSRVEIRNAAP